VANFAASFANVVDTSGKFATGVNISEIIETISDLKAKIYIYVNSTIQRCPNKIIKIFLITDFFICHRYQQHRWCTLSCEYLREISKKFETVLMVYSGTFGKLIHEKNQKSKTRKSRGTVPLTSHAQKSFGKIRQVSSCGDKYCTQFQAVSVFVPIQYSEYTPLNKCNKFP
jgi:hypothetical protein